MDVEKELCRILSEELDKAIINDILEKTIVWNKREQRKIDKKYKKREAKLKKMMRLL